MRVFLTGATGFIGRHLVQRLLADGHTVSAWVRSPSSARATLGPTVELVETGAGAAALERAVANADGIVNLAGQAVLPKRWTKARQASIRASRVETTQALVAAIRAAQTRPKVLVSASGVNYYGDQGDRWLTEDSPPGTGFLTDVTVAWESAARAAEALGVRVVLVRSGVVLGRGGGALETMLPPFRLGLGGPLGDGTQYFPWIHLADEVELLLQAASDSRYAGPINAVAPEAVTMAQLAKAIGRALGRPVLLKVPRLALSLGLGEAATVLLASLRVRPTRLEALGFSFRHRQLDGALAEILRPGR